ncbi:MAG: hypothetical protein PF439_09935 [Helicobacteraceae bacterium]|nr:hypothetical protein [Helicobacteraceae bacterium]
MNGCSSDSNNGSSVSYGLPITSSGVAYSDFNGSVIMDMELSTDGKTLYAAVNDSGTNAHPDAVEHGLTILNLSTGVTEHVDTGLYGRYVKLSKDGEVAYVTAGGDENLSFIDLGTKSVTNSIYIAGYVSGIAVTADGSTLYLGAESDGVATVDVATETVTHIEPMNGGYVTTMILSSDETKVYGSESSGYGLITYNIADNNFTTIDTTNGNAYDFDITSNELTAYVSTGNNNEGVEVISLTDKNVTTSIYDINATDSLDWVKQVKLSADDKLLFIASPDYDDTLFIVDLEDNNTVVSAMNTSATACISPSSVEVSPNGSKVYVGCAEGVIVEYALTAK